MTLKKVSSFAVIGCLVISAAGFSRAATLNIHDFQVGSLNNSSGGLVNFTGGPFDSSYGIIRISYSDGVTTYNPPLPGVVIAIKNGYDYGAWDGASGAISSTTCKAEAATNGWSRFALASLTGAEYRALGTSYSQFHGVAMNSSTDNYALIQFTYAGDFNLDGKIDGNDLSIVEASIASPPAAKDWRHGDANYDGVIDSRDWDILNLQLSVQSQQGTFPTLDIGTVPEPSTLALLGMGAIGLLSWAWRKRKA
jgi:hypothetical protein